MSEKEKIDHKEEQLELFKDEDMVRIQTEKDWKALEEE